MFCWQKSFHGSVTLIT
ncbi:MAG: hypothetical protein GY707_09855 [Desulfobacteraceae bacterium]|nr:hypothetical protein [Desulfobacteraceae bacterium]